jgi:hypothetical protein
MGKMVRTEHDGSLPREINIAKCQRQSPAGTIAASA